MRKVELPTFHSQGCSLTPELYAQIYHLIRRFIRGSVAWVDREYRTSTSPPSGQEEEQATDQDTDRTTKKETAEGQEETKEQKRHDRTYLRPSRASPPTMNDEQPSFHVTGFSERKAHQERVPSNMRPDNSCANDDFTMTTKPIRDHNSPTGGVPSKPYQTAARKLGTLTIKDEDSYSGITLSATRKR
eukprot:g20502.t1